MKAINNVLMIAFFPMLFIACGGEKHNNESESNKVEEIIETVAPKSTHETVELNGVKHAVEIKGEGQPIIVLHGGPGLPHNYLNPYFDELASNYKLFMYDQRGCGDTEFPADTSSINPETYVNDLEALMNHYKIEKAIIIGHSWGSLLALYFAKAFPDKVEKLVLAAPAPIKSIYFDEAFKNMQSKRSEGDNKMLVEIMSSDAFKQGEPEVFLNAIKLGESINLANPTSADEVFKNLSFTVTILFSTTAFASPPELTRFKNFNSCIKGI
jgi:proline iminopeptidase